MKMTKRSGGPRTAAGKQAASRNALKTGAYSRLVLLPGEDEIEFRELEDQFIKDFSPQDIAESAMVRDLAVICWKKLRLEKLEQAEAISRLNAPIRSYEFENFHFEFRDSAWWVLDTLQDITEAEIAEQHLITRHALDLLRWDISEAEVIALLVNNPPLYSNLLHQAELYGVNHGEKLTPEEFVRLQYNGDAQRGSVQFLKVAVEAALEQAEDILWAYGLKDELKVAVADIKVRRLLDFMELDKPRRVNDDLNRNFFRTLTELRKHQVWRQERNTLDITPEQPPKLNP